MRISIDELNPSLELPTLHFLDDFDPDAVLITEFLHILFNKDYRTNYDLICDLASRMPHENQSRKMTLDEADADTWNRLRAYGITSADAATYHYYARAQVSYLTPDEFRDFVLRPFARLPLVSLLKDFSQFCIMDSEDDASAKKIRLTEEAIGACLSKELPHILNGKTPYVRPVDLVCWLVRDRDLLRRRWIWDMTIRFALQLKRESKPCEATKVTPAESVPDTVGQGNEVLEDGAKEAPMAPPAWLRHSDFKKGDTGNIVTDWCDESRIKSMGHGPLGAATFTPERGIWSKSGFSDLDLELIRALGKETWKGAAICEKARRPYDNPAKPALATLKRRGVLNNLGKGYFLTSEYYWLLEE